MNQDYVWLRINFVNNNYIITIKEYPNINKLFLKIMIVKDKFRINCTEINLLIIMYNLWIYFLSEIKKYILHFITI